MEEDNKDGVKKRRGEETQRARKQEEDRKEENGRQNKARSLVQECVWKRNRRNIYLSPDESVLGVHLWRNEISS